MLPTRCEPVFKRLVRSTKGLPLYFFHSDTKPGEMKGSDTGWSLVKP
jgi:predicted lipoprotein with Yx(FWY)xxD motif